MHLRPRPCCGAAPCRVIRCVQERLLALERQNRCLQIQFILSVFVIVLMILWQVAVSFLRPPLSADSYTLAESGHEYAHLWGDSGGFAKLDVHTSTRGIRVHGTNLSAYLESGRQQYVAFSVDDSGSVVIRQSHEWSNEPTGTLILSFNKGDPQLTLKNSKGQIIWTTP